MFTSFKDKLAAVTGGEMGIGKAVVEKLTAAGSRVVIAGIDEQAGRECEQNIQGEVTFVQTDVSQEEQVKEFSKKVKQDIGSVDILVNNAGIHMNGNVVTTEYKDWINLLEINLDGAFLMSKYIIKNHMLPQKSGVIVNISSEAGIDGFKDQVAYNVSKAGMISLTKSTAVDFADDNIRVNAVCPGTTMTPLVEKALEQADDTAALQEELEKIRPLKRLGKPEEIASAVMAVAADELGYATGSVLTIDGGYTAQ